MLVNWQHVGSSQAGWVPGRVQRVLRDTYVLMTDSLSLLVSLVYLNLGRIRLLQYLSTTEILP
jgi:hypothetical protein